MKRAHVGSSILAFGLAAIALSAPAQDTRYRLTPIVSDMPDAQLEAFDLNNKGEVAGAVHNPNEATLRAYLWSGRFIDLGAVTSNVSSADGINDRSDVAGSFWDAQGEHGYLLRHGRNLEILQGLPGDLVGFIDIDNRRRLLGETVDAGQTRHFIWSRGKTTFLQPLAPTQHPIRPREMNDRGVVAGIDGQGEPFEFQRAVIWRNGQATAVVPATLPSGEPIDSSADAINNSDQVAGSLATESQGRRAYVWEDGELTILPPLNGMESSSADDINDAGVVVGYSGVIGEVRATLWDEGVAIDLTQQIDPADPLHDTVKLWEALLINDRGQIVASSLDPNAPGFLLRLYLLTPVR